VEAHIAEPDGFEDERLEHEQEATAASDSSLAGRMERRRSQVEQSHTEKFPVPGWDDIVVVELRPLGWKLMRSIGEKHKRIRDTATQELYTISDQLIRATVGFHEVVGEKTQPTTHTWQTLAAAGLGQEFDTPRKALLALIRDSLVPDLWQEWRDWQKAIGREAEEEVVEDFATTG
jgi:hypothetical protein